MGKGKTTPPDGESEEASCRRWHQRQALRKESRERHFRGRKVRLALGWGPKLSRKKANVSLGQRKGLEQGPKQAVPARAPGVS